MTFSIRNTLGSKARLFDGALRRAIAQDNAVRLRAAAECLLTCAAQGEPWAIGMLADRLDGKCAQSVAIEHSDLRGMSLEQLAEQLSATISGSAFTSSRAIEFEDVH